MLAAIKLFHTQRTASKLILPHLSLMLALVEL